MDQRACRVRVAVALASASTVLIAALVALSDDNGSAVSASSEAGGYVRDLSSAPGASRASLRHSAGVSGTSAAAVSRPAEPGSGGTLAKGLTTASPRTRAAQMLLAGQYRDAMALSQYLLQTRLEDDYWVEAIPTLISAAAKLAELDALYDFMLEQSLRTSVEYPEETQRYQRALLSGFVEALVEVDREDLAGRLIDAVRPVVADDEVFAELVSAYQARIETIRRKKSS